MALSDSLLQLHKTTNAAVIIAITFAVFLCFMIFVFIDYNHDMTHMVQALQKNQQNSEKMKLLSELMELARSRTRLTAQILDTEDTFQQDELNLELEEFTNQFNQRRERFLSLPLQDKERNMLARQGDILPVLLPAQRRVVELAIHGGDDKTTEARKLFYGTVMPAQGYLVELFSELIQFEHQQIEQQSRHTEQAVRFTRENHDRLTLFALFISLIVATVVILRVRNIQRELRHSHDELETAVNKRTKELHRAHSMLQTVLDTIPVRVFWKDSHGNYLGCNTLFAQDAGLRTPEDIIGKDDTQMSWRAEAELYRHDDITVMLSGQAKLNYEEPQTTPNGATVWLETSKIPLMDENGESIGVLGTYQEITERKEAAIRLQRQTSNLRVLSRIASSEIQPISAALKNGLTLAREHLGMDVAIISHIVSNDYTVEYQVSPQEFGLHDGDKFITHNTYCDLTLEKMDVIDIVDMEHSEYAGHPSYRVFKLESYIGAPLMVRGEIYGTINFSSATKYVRQFDDGDREFMRLLARWIGNVIERSQAMERLRISQQHLQQRQQELEVALESARLASQAKSDFLSSMSHELRTPLNAVLGFSQLLESEPNLTTEQVEHVRDIIRAGNHLLDLINEVLDLAKIEAGKLELSIEAVSLQELLLTCHKLIAPLAEQHQIQLQICQDCNVDHYLKADLTRTKQILLNLLSNAVKYNREHGTVSLNCEPQGGLLRIAITDTGFGIPDHKLNRLFDAFDRLGAESSGIEGTGIGLLITKQLVQMMGGELGIESREGQGSTFWFTLPLLADHEKPRSPSPQAVTEPAALKPLAQLGQRKVLYIEDNPVNLKLVSKLIAKQTALQLLSAMEPHSGIELAVREQPDLILLDINLPSMSGYEVLEQLRSMETTRHIPVIALTANAMSDDITRGEEAGFDGYLTKPIQLKAFLKVLQHHLSN